LLELKMAVAVAALVVPLPALRVVLERLIPLAVQVLLMPLAEAVYPPHQAGLAL
jgi:hypothetical protein